MNVMLLQHGQLFHHEDAHQKRPDAMNFRLNCVTMATLPNQNNNERQFQPNRKKFINNAIQITPNKPNDSSPELYELFPAEQ